MRAGIWASLATLALGLVGCDVPRGPRLAISTARAPDAEADEQPVVVARKPQPSAPATAAYQGKTLEQWAQALNDDNPSVVARACRALHVMGATGRPYLIQGLESHNPETRRMCLERLTVSDFKSYGQRGRDVLLKLAGDPADLRIRNQAMLYVGQWKDAIPSPP
jgi:hypothetical protein